MTAFPPLALAVIGLLVLARYHQAVMVFMGIEIVLAAANWLALTAISPHAPGSPALLVLFTLIVSAAETTVGLAVVLRLARRHGTTALPAFSLLKDKEE